MLEFKFLSESNAYPSKYLNVVKQEFLLPDNKTKTFEIHKGGEVVIVLPITDQKEVVCVTQYRVGPQQTMTELPGGFVDLDESPLQAAKREVLEETGYTGDFKQIASIYPDSYSTIKRHVFVCTNAKKVQESNLDDSEFLEINLLPIQDFRKHIQKGMLTHLESAYLAMDFLNFL